MLDSDTNREPIFLSGNNVLTINSPVKASIQDLDSMFNNLEELIENKSYVYVLLNLSESERPNAETREYLKLRLNRVKHKFRHICVYTGANILLSAAVQFMFGFGGVNSYSVHHTIEACLEKFKNAG